MGLHQWIWDFGEENHADSLPLQTAKKKLLDMVENLHSTLFTLKEVLVKIKYIRHCIQFDLASFCLVCMFVTDVLSLSKARPDPQLSLVLLRESEEVAVVASILKNPWWTNSVVPKGNSKDQHIQHVVNLWLWFFVGSTMRWHGDLSLFLKGNIWRPRALSYRRSNSTCKAGTIGISNGLRFSLILFERNGLAQKTMMPERPEHAVLQVS